MRFNIVRAPRQLLDAEPRIGDVYAARQSGRNGAKFHVVVSTSESGLTLHFFSLDAAGSIIAAGQYGRHIFESRDKVGFASLPDTIEIEWL